MYDNKSMPEDDERDIERQVIQVVCYGTFETMVSLKTFRSDIGALFWTMP
jgi:hypothetical protein